MTKQQTLKLLREIRNEYNAKNSADDHSLWMTYGMSNLIYSFDKRATDDPAAELKDFGFKGSFLPGMKITIELPEAP